MIFRILKRSQLLLLAVVCFALTSFGFVSPAEAALPIVQNIFHGDVPENIGVNQGQLAPCPPSPNCVVSQNGDSEHQIKPITYQGDRDNAQATMLQVLSVVPRTQVIEQTSDYIYAQSTSRLMGFVDDLEFYFPQDSKTIQLRSASRMGESDIGVNRRRLEQIRFAIADLKI